ncbi:hypothetical protein DFH06DRAFT_1197308 [Mycena polygramma]|nr:hypothetical protein DFH06DRAFT_1197308 [Mycena polygramma]
MDFLTPSSSDLQLDSYIHVACMALLVYDTVLNLDQECCHVWKSKWGVIKCLYLWTRYGTFIDTALALEKRVNVHIGRSSCRTVTNFDTMFAALGIGIAEIIMMIRTYALYERSKKLLAFFSIMWLAIGGVDIWVVIQWTNSVPPATNTDAPAVLECDLDGSSNIGLVCYISLLAGETVVVLLTVLKGFRTCSLTGEVSRPLRLITTFYRDGIMFYLVMLLTFIVAIILQNVISEPALKFAIDTPLRVMHSILACHLVIHVRAVASEDETNTAAIRSGLVFANDFAESPREGDAAAV